MNGRHADCRMIKDAKIFGEDVPTIYSVEDLALRAMKNARWTVPFVSFFT